MYPRYYRITGSVVRRREKIQLGHAGKNEPVEDTLWRRLRRIRSQGAGEWLSVHMNMRK